RRLRLPERPDLVRRLGVAALRARSHHREPKRPELAERGSAATFVARLRRVGDAAVGEVGVSRAPEALRLLPQRHGAIKVSLGEEPGRIAVESLESLPREVLDRRLLAFLPGRFPGTFR